MDLIWHDRTELEIRLSDVGTPTTDSWDVTAVCEVVGGIQSVLQAHRRRGVALGPARAMPVRGAPIGHRTAMSKYDETNEASRAVVERLGARWTGNTMELSTEPPATEAVS